MSHFGELQFDLLGKLKDGEISRQDAQYKVEEYWVGSLRDAAVDGDVEHGSLMAGQSVGIVNRVQPLREILQDLVNEADQGLADVQKLLSR
jgi:enoyl-[acyl-carrier protein] reductase II